MENTQEKMTVVKFNRHLQKITYDEHSCRQIYDFSIAVMKVYLRRRFGNKDYIEDIVHEIFMERIFFKPQNSYIIAPIPWLCRIAKNYTLSMLKLKDNTTLELLEDYSYLPELEDNVIISNEKFEKQWSKLDESTREIIIFNELYGYHLYELADMLGLSYTCVRTRVSRAKRNLKKK